MNTPNRDLLRIVDGNRRRSARQALAVIPNIANTTLSPGDVLAPEVNTMDNLLNSRHAVDAWSPAPSPDELVIQKRGRRKKTIVWSPDRDTNKRSSLLSLSSRDNTPVKSPNKTNIVLRKSPRKRLVLGDESSESLFLTPEKRKPTTNLQKSMQTDDRFSGELINGLRGLSHDQLINMIMDLVNMQEEGEIQDDQKLKNILLQKMPVADISPLKEILSTLQYNIYICLTSSNLKDNVFNYFEIHLKAFHQAILDQGTNLVKSQHWISVMQYVFMAWPITQGLPKWEAKYFNWTTNKCFKLLAQFCLQAIKFGNFSSGLLDTYKSRLQTMTEDCEDIRICLRLLEERKHDN
ncbi:uncharacterized protein [Prorops nasuta]|uniref:uncharacterized protein n=1 Tax=Prorops nasuta TaxID=863751 RepID=UPI0034CDC02D